MIKICYTIADFKNIDKKRIGVYAIFFKNCLKFKFYIGSAARSFKDRWINHLYDLRKNIHDSKKLQCALKKYSEENIVFMVLYICDKSDCVRNEQFFIDFYNSYENGYNCRPFAASQLGFKHSEKTKKYIAEMARVKRLKYKDEILSLYGQNLPIKEISKKLNICKSVTSKVLHDEGVDIKTRGSYIKKTIYQYSLSGELINEWGSIYEFCKESENLGLHSGVYNVLKNKQSHFHNFFFSYLKMKPAEVRAEIIRLESIRLEKAQINRKKVWTKKKREDRSLKSKGNNFRGRIKNIKQFDLEWNLIKVWKDSKEIVNFFKLKNFSPVLRVLRKKRNKYKNFYWTL